MPKLNTILLVDDDKTTNFFNQFILSNAAASENVIVKDEPSKALEFLLGLDHPPCLILLDINMPGMSGFELLEQFTTQKPEMANMTNVYMLTTSMYEADRQKAEAFEQVKGLIIKPLSKEKVDDVIAACTT